MKNITLTIIEAPNPDNNGKIESVYQETFWEKIRYYVKKRHPQGKDSEGLLVDLRPI